MKSAGLKVVAVLAGSALLASLAMTAAVADDCEGVRSGTRLVVAVSGVRAARGEVVVTLYPDNARRFLAPRSKLLRVRTPAQTPVTTACFWLPAPAHYALAVYHDENGNRDFDRTLIGLPAEGFGFSNDPPTPSSLPSFKAVRFR